MDGIAQVINSEVIARNFEARNNQPTVTLRHQVEQALQLYFTQLDGNQPSNLYKMVLKEVEVPLLKAVLKYTRGNQCKAAEILRISRGTLRKKMEMYDID